VAPIEAVRPEARAVHLKKCQQVYEPSPIELLKDLAHPDITAFADDLQEKIPELLAPLEWLEQQLTPALNSLDDDTATFIVWAWQHRHEFDLAA